MPVNGILVQRKDKIHTGHAGAGGYIPAPDNRKVMAPADEGWIVEIQINPVSKVIEQLGYQSSCTVDTISRFATDQHRYLIHTVTPYVPLLQSGVYTLA
jgi:hypothetical protein